ncbi:MAG: Holliday junction resolvase RuvX [Psittacicella sp.]
MNFTILAFDFGTKCIGCSVGQSITKTSSPLAAQKVKSKDTFPLIDQHIKEWKPKYLVVGLPLNSSGDNLLGKSYNRFLDYLRRTGVEVILINEYLTTKEAREYLFDKYGYRGLKKDKIDSISACLIAESWFNNI